MPAAARGAERDRVALVEHILFLRIGLGAVDPEFAGRAVLAALDAEGREDRALGQKGDGDRRLAPAFDQDLLAEPAAFVCPSLSIALLQAYAYGYFYMIIFIGTTDHK